ncbi:hypothetical protein [Candidatus Amarolinea aalborgensis]|uniref:hypothetical protein n=1 Tax=Candidatus Amarolinea aalborgensis TaxID=2249329 RepID=UPI003BF9A241
MDSENTEMSNEPPWESFYMGGFPAGGVFSMHVHNLHRIVEKAVLDKDDEYYTNTLSVCFIGLISYFEAFSKDHFVALINICPQLLARLKADGHDVSIDATDFLRFGDAARHTIGSFVGQKYDFGTPKRINSLYQSMLAVTPFSKDDTVRFNELLNDRHLLVHHGGVYTTSYASQQSSKSPGTSRVFFDSLTITKDRFNEATLFLQTIAQKTIHASERALREFIAANNIVQSNAQKEATYHLTMWFEF